MFRVQKIPNYPYICMHKLFSDTIKIIVSTKGEHFKFLPLFTHLPSQYFTKLFENLIFEKQSSGNLSGKQAKESICV